MGTLCGNTGDVLSRQSIQQRRRHRQRPEEQTVKHGQASNTQRGARVVFGTTLDGLATRNRAGSGLGAWETRHCEPLGAAIGLQTTEKTTVGCL
jgi:hypothetical protein